MAVKTQLLRSVSAAAMILGGATAASAEFANGLPEYYFSVEGGLVVSEPASDWGEFEEEFFDKFGDFSDLDESLGGYGAAQFGKFVTPNVDWRAAFAYTHFADNETENRFSEGDAFANFTEGFSWWYATADFDVGYHPQMPSGTDLRLFAGLRGLYSVDSSLKMGEIGELQDSFAWDFGIDQTFFGGGPRVGAEFETRVNGSWGWSALIAGAALFGERETDASIELSECIDEIQEFCDLLADVDETETSSATVFNLDAAVSIDYYLTEQSKFSVGVRAQQFWDLREGGGLFETDALAWGPFVKYVLRM